MTVTQRSQIKRQKARLETLQKEEEAEREQARLRARERVLRDFERTQNGFVGSSMGPNNKSTKSEEENRKSDFQYIPAFLTHD